MDTKAGRHAVRVAGEGGVMKTDGNASAFAVATKWQADSSGAACNTGYEVTEVNAGLTKREYFAALAMQGMLAENYPVVRVGTLADDAVFAADALIAALNKEVA
jgi:hypothetical protein